MDARAGSRRDSLHKGTLQLCLAAALTTACVLPTADAQAQGGRWVASWTASPQPVWGADFAFPTNIPQSLTNATIRQVARLSLGGGRLRVELSNAYGERALRIGEAHVALADGGSRIVAGSDRKLTFGGREEAIIPAGAPLISDPVDLVVPALGSLAITLYLPDETPLTTFHWDGRQTAYMGKGNQVAAQEIVAQGIAPDATTGARAFLSAILVEPQIRAGLVVALGDSITDGNGVTQDSNQRWTDLLAERLAPRNVAVVNAGISGARLLSDRMGVNALARFDRDVLGQPGVKAVILLMGINDISWPGTIFAPEEKAPSVGTLVAAYRQLIARARSHGVRIVGATLTPFEGALSGTPLEGYYNTEKETLRQKVNAWMRASGEFDALIDFDALTRDKSHPTRLGAIFDSGDHLHPGDRGNKAIADAIDLEALLGERATP
ncbi:Lysophospholipase L1 [Rhizobiales bacterium GAS113]|nr:Lysophospholipase L1 [Rhizobiales bacterium GAS113]